MDAKKIEKYRSILLAKKEQIIESVEGMTHSDDEPSPMALDVGDRALSSYEKELTYHLTDTEKKLLELVLEALDRMEKGGFGMCVECKKPIQDARINAIPWARHCIHCQELQEKGLIP